MTSRELTRLLKGRKIVSVSLRPFPSGRGRQLATDPVIRLDDGTHLYFNTQETEVGAYGVEVSVVRGGISI